MMSSEEQDSLVECLLPTETEDDHQDSVDAAADDTVDAASVDAAENVPGASRTPRRPPALAWAPSTHLLAKLVLPLLIILSHVLFYYGQTANMWRLFGSWNVDLSFSVASVEVRKLFRTIGIPTHGSFHQSEAKDLRTFTYYFAIRELWRAKGMAGVFIPRLASLGLVVFSGIWPHVKLFMLLMTWWFSRKALRRKRILTSLSILGKWSLVDVLVVVSMVGVLNVSFDFTADKLMTGVKHNLPSLLTLFHSMYKNEDVCTATLKYSCHNPRRIDKKVACNLCKTAVAELIEHPTYARSVLDGINVSGGGAGQLYVAGLDGIYSFCAAVILSILLSFVVDWYDLQYRKSREAEVNEERRTGEPEVSGTLSATGAEHDSLMLREVEQGDRRTSADRAFDMQIFVERQQTSNRIWQVVAVVTAIIVALGTVLITTERKVHGAIPSLVHELLGIEWSTSYNFWQLGWVTGKSGGRDYMLVGTFVWFVIAGPLLRAFLNILASFYTHKPEMNPSQMDRCKRTRELLSTWIDFIGAFCAWEVVTVASMMVDLLMPSITSTLLHDDRCSKLGQGTDMCFESEFNMTKMFGFVIAGFVLLLVVSHRARSYRFCE